MQKVHQPVPATLLLQDGSVFRGKSLGKTGTTTGEICFNTGMTGYQEIFTDPSYSGQIIIMTNDHIGNYGTLPAETESEAVQISGMICKRFTAHQYSRLSSAESLQDYFERYGLVGISHVDTRALTIHVRSQGAMNCIISSETNDVAELKKLLAQVPDMNGLDLSKNVSTRSAYEYGDASAPLRVAVLDCGIKTNILRSFAERGIFCKVFPSITPLQEIIAWNPDGFFISNGPGDPSAMPYAIETVKGMQSTGKPLFGICLGHQLLALSNGIPTRKMHHGHRGINHPVKNLETGLSEITSQNHGFEVSREHLDRAENVILTHINLNDQTVEGIRIRDRKAFSVQYHPESCPGPHDSRYLFDRFREMMMQN